MNALTATQTWINNTSDPTDPTDCDFDGARTMFKSQLGSQIAIMTGVSTYVVEGGTTWNTNLVDLGYPQLRVNTQVAKSLLEQCR